MNAQSRHWPEYAKLGQSVGSTRIDMVATVVKCLVRRADSIVVKAIVRRLHQGGCGPSGQVGARVRAVVQDGPAAMQGSSPATLFSNMTDRRSAVLRPCLDDRRNLPGSTVSVRIARDRERRSSTLRFRRYPRLSAPCRAPCMDFDSPSSAIMLSPLAARTARYVASDSSNLLPAGKRRLS